MGNKSIKAGLEEIFKPLPSQVSTSERQYKNCEEFLKYNEWALAFESLIELAEETEILFPDKFWIDLIEVAKKMKMESEITYCQEKLKR
jgi:hypothetical protein